MTDVTSHKPISVSINKYIGPYIHLPESQLAEVCRLLDDNRIRYEVDENALSIDDGPEMTDIYLGLSADAIAIQAILDKAN